jgi:serine/threonine-protein kinase
MPATRTPSVHPSRDGAAREAPRSPESLFARLVAIESCGARQALALLSQRHPDLAHEFQDIHDAYARAVQVLDDEGEEAEASAPSAERYEDRGLLGTGGGGEVREVWDRRLRRPLAMKRLAWLGDEPGAARLARFLTEARLTASLDHPGVVPVHDLGCDEDGRPYFMMRRVQGRTLREIVDEMHAAPAAHGADAWTVARAVDVLARACETVAYAHSKGILHRDLKPANLMVGPFGETYVLDWGLARARGMRGELLDASGLNLTIEGDVLGTPAYMAPEQAGGDHGALDARADVYALGAALYHMLAGYAPYANLPADERGAEKLLARLLLGPPTPLARCAPLAPPELARICERAMAREPEDRYADALELARALRGWLERGTRAPLERPRPLRFARPLIALLGAASAGAALALWWAT